LKPAGTDNAREMLLKAEMALASGSFVQAGRIARNASGLLNRTQELHRKFMKRMKKALSSILDMEEKGYDVTEALGVLEKAKEKAMKAEYDRALQTVDLIKPALERAAYLPFPLLNKTVDIISTIFFSGGKVSYTVRIENPTEEPLGEIIIRPYLSEEDFHEVPEKPFGVIGGMEYKEYTFYLTPKEGRDWNLGIGREVLMGEGVTMRTKLSSRSGNAKYLVVVENNSDQVLRDILISPQVPEGLMSEPAHGLIDSIEPFSTGSVTFDLYPAALDTETRRSLRERTIPLPEEEEEEFVIEDEGEEEEEELELDQDEFDVEVKDFTPVQEKYNLIEMAPDKLPEEVERSLIKGSKHRSGSKKKR